MLEIANPFMAATTMTWILLLGTVTGLSIGQVLFKLGANHVNSNAASGMVAWVNFPIVTALVIYAICTLLWIGVLRVLPLKIAYPVAALSYVLVPVLGHLFLREEITLRTMLGGALIIGGVAIATSSQ
jgi:drug/metabolite transporter (DMT)-like permease